MSWTSVELPSGHKMQVEDSVVPRALVEHASGKTQWRPVLLTDRILVFEHKTSNRVTIAVHETLLKK